MQHRYASPGRTWVLFSCVVACVATQRPRVPAADLGEPLAEPPAKENKAAEVRPTSTEGRYKLELVRSTDKRVAARGGGGTVYQVAVTPDGKRVLIGGDARIPVAMLWNLETGAMERFINVFEMDTDGSPISVAIGPDGNKAAFFTSRNRIFLVEFARRNLLHRLDRYGFTFGIQYAPDGKQIALFEASGVVTFIDSEKGEEVFRLRGHKGGGLLCFSPDGTRLVSGSTDKTARIWDVPRRKEIRALKHESWVWSVAFSPDGKRVATGTGGPIEGPSLGQNYVRNDDNNIRIWDVATGELLQTLAGHTDRVQGIQFVHGGKHLVSGSYDGSLRLWDLTTGKELAQFQGQTAIFCVALAANDQVVASGGSTRDANGHWKHVAQERVRVFKIEETR